MGNYSSSNRKTPLATATEPSTSVSSIPETSPNDTNLQQGNSQSPETSLLWTGDGSKTPSSSASDGNQDPKVDNDDNQRPLDPNSKRKLGNKRKLAESSDSSTDDESLETHRKGLVRQRPSLRKHQVPQPKLPKIITHNKK